MKMIGCGGQASSLGWLTVMTVVTTSYGWMKQAKVVNETSLQRLAEVPKGLVRSLVGGTLDLIGGGVNIVLDTGWITMSASSKCAFLALSSYCIYRQLRGPTPANPVQIHLHVNDPSQICETSGKLENLPSLEGKTVVVLNVCA